MRGGRAFGLLNVRLAGSDGTLNVTISRYEDSSMNQSNRNKSYSLWVVFLLLFFSTAGFAQEKPLVAVMPFAAQNASASDAVAVTLLFENALVNTQAFIVLEQKKRVEILSTQEDSLFDCADQSCAVRIGIFSPPRASSSGRS